jgi:hypothetical protein
MIEEQKRLAAIHHLVHEYTNLVSSAEIVTTGTDVDEGYLKPPINTHVSHAFYLNCRKLADFFQNVSSRQGDNIMAAQYVSGYKADLIVSDAWRDAINKQLAHVTYARDERPQEISRETERALYAELKETWRQFRDRLPEPYRSEFKRKVKERKEPLPTGEASPFRTYDLD